MKPHYYRIMKFWIGTFDTKIIVRMIYLRHFDKTNVETNFHLVWTIKSVFSVEFLCFYFTFVVFLLLYANYLLFYTFHFLSHTYTSIWVGFNNDYLETQTDYEYLWTYFSSEPRSYGSNYVLLKSLWQRKIRCVFTIKHGNSICWYSVRLVNI